MARPREFDIDEAIEDAMNVFWQHGYDASSLPLLLTGMTLTRGSFYKAFSGKRNLFLVALKRYEEHAVDPAVVLLTSSEIPNGSDRIIRLFKNVIDVVRDGDHRGCLLCSAAAGPAAIDPQIAQSVHKIMDRMLIGFETALGQSAAHVGITKKKNSELAKHLLTQYVGLRVLARSNASIDLLQGSLNSLANILDLPPQIQP